MAVVAIGSVVAVVSFTAGWVICDLMGRIFAVAFLCFDVPFYRILVSLDGSDCSVFSLNVQSWNFDPYPASELQFFLTTHSRFHLQPLIPVKFTVKDGDLGGFLLFVMIAKCYNYLPDTFPRFIEPHRHWSI